MRYFRNQVRQYVLLFEGRTGSTFLTEALGQHPGVLALDEKLIPLRSRADGAAAQLAWTRAFFTPPLVGKHCVRGFKTKLKDIVDPDGFADLLRHKRVRIMHMQRRNVVKLAVSGLRGQRLNQQTANWNLYNEADRVGAMTFEPAVFDDFLRAREQRERSVAEYVQSLKLPTLPIYYEDLLRDEAAFLRAVCAFLGLRALPVRPAVKKNTSDDLRLVLKNFDELRAHYSGTPYQAMFDEVLVPEAPGD